MATIEAAAGRTRGEPDKRKALLFAGERSSQEGESRLASEAGSVAQQEFPPPPPISQKNHLSNDFFVLQYGNN